jgi:hypothetical protein
MEEYRERDTPTVMSATQSDPLSVVTLDGWQQFIADYEAELADGQATFNRNPTQQSVQEEYATYVMGALSAGSTSDTLGFWRVGNCYEIHKH